MLCDKEAQRRAGQQQHRGWRGKCRAEHRGKHRGLAVMHEVVEADEDGRQSDRRENRGGCEIEISPAKEQARGQPATPEIKDPKEFAGTAKPRDVQSRRPLRGIQQKPKRRGEWQKQKDQRRQQGQR